MSKQIKNIYSDLVGLDTAKRLQSKYGFAIVGGDTVQFQDDFLGDVLDARWAINVGSDGSAPPTVAILSGVVNGVLRVRSSDSNTSVAADGASLVQYLQWRASQGGLTLEARVALDAITTTSAFIGFTDSLALEQPIFSAASGNTLTTDATDAVGFMFDTRMTADNLWLVGVANNVDATAQDTLVAPVAGTYIKLRVELSTTGVATFYINDVQVGTTMAAAVTPSVLLTPVIFTRSLVAADRNVDVDYVSVSALRG